MKRVTLVSAMAALVVLAAGGLVFAAEESESLLDGKLRAGENIEVEAGEVIVDDLYLFGTSSASRLTSPGTWLRLPPT